ncbi:linear amide C-N hydrolase [bacterium]|nr:linear amide C-N hydrolase [bacterium]
MIGHNLDQNFHTPGMIHVNRRSERKRSVSSFDLKLSNIQTPILEWTSKYGSVTFSLLGRNLPDGGMNEAGLTVNEMALGGSVFPFVDSLPAMLIHLWIQYQLDNHATVGEVLEHLENINIEPRSTFTPPASAQYHFFVTDNQGDVAIIEFLHGGPRIYKNESVPVPALCNLAYPHELERLKTYRGIGGRIRRLLDSGKDMRFIKCAEALEAFKASTNMEPTEFCFDLLKRLQVEETRQWSVVYDVKHRHVYFRTTRGVPIKYFDFDSLDFSTEAAPVVIENIDLDAAGDISDQFAAFSPDADRSVIDRFLRSLVRFVAKTDDAEQMDRHMLDHYGMDMNHYISRALEITELVRTPKDG